MHVLSGEASSCPECGKPLRSLGLTLARREDDGRRTCRAVWRCSDQHTWWRWADRSGDVLEVCPADLFR